MLHPASHSRQSSYAGSHRPRVTSHYSMATTAEEEDEDAMEMIPSCSRVEEHDPDVQSSRPSLEAGTLHTSRSLEHTIDRIGLGPYQYRLLILCGLGWTSDNATLQSLALILPRVATHFSLTPTTSSLLSASLMFGMLIGSIGWGSASDVIGRRIPFNATLGLTGVFGLLGSWVGSFAGLCVVMMLVGSAVGGSMPTDGTLFLENLPENKQYLLTLLSIFFSLGAVVSSVIGYIALPGHSCMPDKAGILVDCDIEAGDNNGWRRVLFILGLLNLTMFAFRFLLFRLYESPRFLVANGKGKEALVVLNKIAEFNSVEMGELGMEDIGEPEGNGQSQGMKEDLKADAVEARKEDLELDRQVEEDRQPFLPVTDVQRSLLGNGRPAPSGEWPPNPSPNRRMNSSTPFDIQKSKTYTATAALPQSVAILEEDSEREDYFQTLPADPSPTFQPSKAIPPPSLRRLKSRKSFREIASRTTIEEGMYRVKTLFEPKWKRTTLLMWAIWGLMSLAYTMFNVWLPTVLQGKAAESGDGGLHEALFEMVLYSAAGTPGSIIGAYSIESSIGRRKSLAIFTLLTALSTFAFTFVSSQLAVVISSMVISVAATAMYAVLYGMTPEIFGIEIRGTACGTSAALSRLTGILAPILAGTLLSISASLPLFTSAVVFAVAAGCAVFLPFEKSAGGKARGGGGLGH